MVSRFEILDKEYIKELKDKSKNENTRKSTEYWKNVFKKWANERNFQANLEEYETDVLDQTLSQFYPELRKENRDDYEPDCLKVMQASLESYLKSKASQSPSSKIGSFLSPEKSWKARSGNCESRAKESKQTDPEVRKKKSKKSSGRTASLA